LDSNKSIHRRREQEGEVFMNMNPMVKKGQFSIKDDEYGDAALARLAEVLSKNSELNAPKTAASRP